MGSTIFDLCTPRADALAGRSSDADFAADLSDIVRGSGGPVAYTDAARFFTNTLPTRGLKNLLTHVYSRQRDGSAVSAICRSDTSFGGGKWNRGIGVRA